MLKRYSRACLIAVLALLAVGVAAQPILLEYKFTPGEIEKYALSLNMSVRIPGVQTANGQYGTSFSASMPYTQKTLGILPDGSARIRVTYGQPSFSGPSKARMPKMAAKSMVLTVTRRGQVLSVEGLNGPAAGAMLQNMDFSSLFGCGTNGAIFPDVPVDIGDGWKQSVPLPFPNSQMNVTTSLESYDEQIMNRRVTRLNQLFDGSIDLTALMKQVMASVSGGNSRVQMPEIGKMDLNGQMVFYFAPSIGKLMKGSGTIQASMDINMPPEAIQRGAPQRLSMQLDLAMEISKLK